MDLQQDITQLPSLPVSKVTLQDARTLEIELQKGQSLNEVFQCLDQQQIPVVSMRNKANRLEELFVSLVDQQLTTA